MTGPHPAVAAARSAVRAETADLPPGSLVLVACSGGADSLALAAATAFIAPRDGLRAGAVVVDHGLQPASADVADVAAAQCRELGLDPVEVVRVDVEPSGHGSGPEAAARTARYEALSEAARRHGAAAVLLGHTVDDQAETVLLGLARGSGARSLAGMARRRGELRRPFLGLRRAATEEVCGALGLVPWSDPTNDPATHAEGAGPAPLRSRLRHEAMPALEAVLGPAVPEALARTAGQLRQDADLLDQLAAELLAEARLESRSERDVELDVGVLAAAPPALRGRALRAALVAAGCPSGALAMTHVEAVETLLLDWRGQGPAALPGGVRATRRYGRLVVLSTTS